MREPIQVAHQPMPPTLAQLVRTLRQMGAEQIWLYGSVAKGTARPDSDVDLFAVAPPEARRAIERRYGVEYPPCRVMDARGSVTVRWAQIVTASVTQTNDPALFKRMQPEARRV